MTQPVKSFGDVAQKLARNPLGIIALFIVLVYGLAALVAGFGGSLSETERLPLIYFLVAFPVLVLLVFAWLVSRHSAKLFSPGDFRDEENYVRTIEVATSLAVASSRGESQTSVVDIGEFIRTAQEAVTRVPRRRDSILWVDDRPDNNVYERRAFEAMGISFTLALSTDEALRKLSEHGFAAIISDMGRNEGPREGYVLLDKLRSVGDGTPLFIYAGSRQPEHLLEAQERGAQGCTNDSQELFMMVMRTVVSQ